MSAEAFKAGSAPVRFAAESAVSAAPLPLKVPLVVPLSVSPLASCVLPMEAAVIFPPLRFVSAEAFKAGSAPERFAAESAVSAAPLPLKVPLKVPLVVPPSVRLLASFALVTALPAIFAEVTALAASCEESTARSAIFAEVTLASAR